MSHDGRVRPTPPAVAVAIAAKARALGARGERWLSDLPATVAGLERTFGLVAGAALAGGSSGYVAAATARDGRPVVLKVALPDGLEGNGGFAQQLLGLRLGQGHGYVELLAVDETARAVVLERLGRPMSELALPIEARLEAVAVTLSAAWQRPAGAPGLRSGAEQADFLRRFIADRWRALGRPGRRATIDRALACARTRRDAFDAATAVVVHGDAHPANLLEAAEAPSGYRLIDPDVLSSEPAHDLAICVRDASEELLAGDPLATARGWCARLGRTARADPEAVFEWAFVERVSTGLFLASLGERRGRLLLEVAERQVAGGGRAA